MGALATPAPAVAGVRAPAGLQLEWLDNIAAQRRWLPEWEADHQRRCGDDLGSHPAWCLAVEAAQPGSLHVARLRRDGDLPAFVPVRWGRETVDCQLGELPLCRPHLRVLRPLGNSAALSDGAVCEALVRGLARAPLPKFDLLRLVVPTASSAWIWLQRGDWRRWGWRGYQPGPAVAHFLLRLPECYEQYLAKFSRRSRHHRANEMQQLKREGVVRVASYRRSEQVVEFLQVAQAISRRSYQHRMLGAGLAENWYPRMLAMAARGWWRSYVLYCGDVACSFLLGYQFGGRYYYCSVGYDPAWRKFSPGTVLQTQVIEDLFRHDRATVMDLGPEFPQKRYFGTESFEEGEYWLFRPGVRARLVRHLHWAARAASRSGGELLARCHLKTKTQHALRRLHGC